ncbi:phage tail protein (plasmid) [Rhizobium bangladeshense]|uniref:phage tail protein n=1 Tax=Rhizobium bangladeshense TaxID=1138189 RepID=UPI001A985BE5|nr:phage tail protein [Rhizobium bangladeshense]QSY98657.1 phage tail protein [Rhizobium bangladeshense]
MTTPTLPTPNNVEISVGSSRDEVARVLKAQFGNGYAQRAGDGLNAINAEYSVAFENLTRDEAKIMTDFFIERAGWKAFYFTPPDQDTPRLWTCEKWRTIHVGPIHDTVSATFTQVFAP